MSDQFTPTRLQVEAAAKLLGDQLLVDSQGNVRLTFALTLWQPWSNRHQFVDLLCAVEKWLYVNAANTSIYSELDGMIDLHMAHRASGNPDQLMQATFLLGASIGETL